MRGFEVDALARASTILFTHSILSLSLSLSLSHTSLSLSQFSILESTARRVARVCLRDANFLENFRTSMES